ncbi:MAG TPA: sugar transferase [Actinomycetota bacterium]|nr:sugar transferase [Actinomycetota bacterium]
MADRVLRRRGKEWRERALAVLLLIPAAPVIALCALGIKLEGLLDRRARGPVFFFEDRVSRGDVFKLIKFRTLNAAALDALGPGPTHIKSLEGDQHLTRMGRFLHRWYLDELPQLWNIVRGDMFLIGTRPWPLDIYAAEIERGITRKRDMPAGLVGPVQSRKGEGGSDVALDLAYWEAFKTYPAWKLLLLDLRILMRSAKVQLEHKGL